MPRVTVIQTLLGRAESKVDHDYFVEAPASQHQWQRRATSAAMCHEPRGPAASVGRSRCRQLELRSACAGGPHTHTLGARRRAPVVDQEHHPSTVAVATPSWRRRSDSATADSAWKLRYKYANRNLPHGSVFATRKPVIVARKRPRLRSRVATRSGHAGDIHEPPDRHADNFLGCRSPWDPPTKGISSLSELLQSVGLPGL